MWRHGSDGSCHGSKRLPHVSTMSACSGKSLGRRTDSKLVAGLLDIFKKIIIMIMRIHDFCHLWSHEVKLNEQEVNWGVMWYSLFTPGASFCTCPCRSYPQCQSQGASNYGVWIQGLDTVLGARTTVQSAQQLSWA